MLVIESQAPMHAWSRQNRRAGRRIALVPTMGALHAGHLALIADARRRAEAVVVSIFVNPLQFNRPDDFDRYPRDLGADLAHCEASGVDAIYAPTQGAMYGERFQTRVVSGALAEPLEGAGRPGHFAGVVTVVTKLFNAVDPDIAVFGEKDFQQLAVIGRLVADLDLDIEIVGVATVREPDGLALSSRNSRLTTEQRLAARVVPMALRAVEDAIRFGATEPSIARGHGVAVVEHEPLARLEYLELVDPDALTPVDRLEARILVVAAVWFGDVRLIDNRLIDVTG